MGYGHDDLAISTKRKLGWMSFHLETLPFSLGVSDTQVVPKGMHIP